MDLKISFLSVIRVIFFRRCFFTQILNSLYQGGQIFNISDRFYNYLGYGSSIYFISILIEFLYFTVFVSGLLAGNAIPVNLILIKILLCSHWNHWSPFFFFLVLSFSLVFFWWSYITTPFLFCQYFFAIFSIISVLFLCSHFISVICINFFRLFWIFYQDSHCKKGRDTAFLQFPAFFSFYFLL